MPSNVCRAARIAALLLLACAAATQLRAQGSRRRWTTLGIRTLQTLQNDLTGPVATSVSVLTRCSRLAAPSSLWRGIRRLRAAGNCCCSCWPLRSSSLGNNFLTALGLTGAVL